MVQGNNKSYFIFTLELFLLSLKYPIPTAKDGVNLWYNVLYMYDLHEDEKYVLLICPMYNGVRQALFTQACYINSDFMSYDEDAKLRFLFNDDAIVSKCAKTCLKIINIRSNVINYVR